MKIGIFTDIHANLPALEKSLQFFEKEGCDQIIHIGDMIGIGPYPKECLELAFTYPNLECVMGNHDYYFAHGLPDKNWMSEEEIAHQNWTHDQLKDELKEEVAKWPFQIDIQLKDDYKISFLHYALKENGWDFKSIAKDPDEKSMDEVFAEVDANLILFGHHHIYHYFKTQKEYFNPGSAGCWNKPIARLAILQLKEGELDLKRVFSPYKDGDLMKAFDDRKVPSRDFIRKVFINR
ncbi:MAG: YfcE family phosphodiesterase [Bacteroidia bacterium]|nr:YfcE family phosphodiesterase [Bacteroidia bacterium]